MGKPIKLKITESCVTPDPPCRSERLTQQCAGKTIKMIEFDSIDEGVIYFTDHTHLDIEAESGYYNEPLGLELTLANTRDSASHIVSKWPKWKQNALEQSGKSTVDQPRKPIINKDAY